MLHFAGHADTISSLQDGKRLKLCHTIYETKH